MAVSALNIKNLLETMDVIAHNHHPKLKETGPSWIFKNKINITRSNEEPLLVYF
jgi:hypothetical protein